VHGGMQQQIIRNQKRKQNKTKKNERHESKAPGMHPSCPPPPQPTPSHPIPFHFASPATYNQPTNQQQHIHPNLTHPLPPSFSYPQRATHQLRINSSPFFALLFSLFFSVRPLSSFRVGGFVEGGREGGSVLGG